MRRIDSAAAEKKWTLFSQRTASPPHQAQVRLVDERGGLQRLTRSLPCELAAGQATQLVVDRRQKPVGGLTVPLDDLLEDSRNVVHQGPMVAVSTL